MLVVKISKYLISYYQILYLLIFIYLLNDNSEQNIKKTKLVINLVLYSKIVNDIMM